VKLPKSSSALAELFAELVPDAAGVVRKPMFGMPTAFVNGNMFTGLFGEGLTLRLSADDRVAVAAELPSQPFAPMPSRPMKEYVLVRDPLRADRAVLEAWIGRSLEFASVLPAKQPKPRKSTAAGA
jgi:TfoX/Sxy family transcriptional regulator of competence genes